MDIISNFTISFVLAEAIKLFLNQYNNMYMIILCGKLWISVEGKTYNRRVNVYSELDIITKKMLTMVL